MGYLWSELGEKNNRLALAAIIGQYNSPWFIGVLCIDKRIIVRIQEL